MLLVAAQASHRAGRLEDAASVYQNLLDRDADDADACYGLGTVLLQQGEFVEAVRLLRHAVELEPMAPEIVFNFALALEASKDMERARAACRRAAELARGRDDLLLRICRKLLDLGMSRDVCRVLRSCGVANKPILVLKAKAEVTSGDWGGALATLRELDSAYPEEPGIWRSIATAAAHLHDYRRSLQAYDRYLSLIAPGKNDWLAHADLLLRAKEATRARQAVSQALDAGDRQPQALLIAARCARLDGDYDSARDYVSEAIEKRPGFGSAWQLLFECIGPDEWPGFASDCIRVLSRGDGTPRERVAIELIAGRALEKLERYDEAFVHFARGNRQHRALLEQNGKGYDTDSTAMELERICQLFPTDLRRSGAPNVRVRPIFIVGMPRSGTTLVERMLACLEGVQGGGEIPAMECVAEQYYWDLRCGRIGAPDTLDNAAWEGLATQYALRVPETEALLIDKMPHNARHVGLICALFPSAPIIYMRRDPRDACLSIYSRPFPDDHRYACDMIWLADFCARITRLMEYWKAILPHRILEVRYEELVDEPEAVTRELADFCNVHWSPQCLEFHENVQHSFTFSEIQVRQPLNRDGIGRWRHYERQLQPLIGVLEEHGLVENEHA